MLISELNSFYDTLFEQGKVLSDAYTKQLVHYTILLTAEGRLDDIISCKKIANTGSKSKKIKYIPREIILPKRTTKSAIDSNYIEHRPLYIFGLDYVKKEKKFTANNKKANKSHDAFVKLNLEFLQGLDSVLINAYRKFLKNWDPEKEIDNKVLQNTLPNYGSEYFQFALSGDPGTLLHEDPLIKDRWLKTYEASKNAQIGIASFCPVEGKNLNTARIHGIKIKGVKGAQSSGGVLVGVNNESEESYNRKQGANANISEEASVKYTKSLNYLISSKYNRKYLDDLTMVYWVSNGGESLELGYFNLLVNNDNQLEKDNEIKLEEELHSYIHAQFNKMSEGRYIDFNKLDINPNLKFNIIGLAPNSSRIMVKFHYIDTFGNIITNAMQHQKDLIIKYGDSQIPLYRLLKELVSPNSSKEIVYPDLQSQILKSIITGQNYPTNLLATVVRRIKTDSDTKDGEYIQINKIRAGIVKACINRKYRLKNKEEVITMSLNLENTNPAYLCGRLFAVLENIQRKAATGNLNVTIKDSYFSSACSNPALVFPKLLKLSQHHLKKLKFSFKSEEKVGEILNSLTSNFPKNLSLEQQGIFIIGYYQQRFSSQVNSDTKELENDKSKSNK